MTAADDAPTLTGRSTRQLLTDRTFGTYFVANLISNCGSWLQNIAAAVVVYRLTRSNIAVGAVSMLQFAASLLLSPWAGAVSDRMDRRLLLITGQVIAVAGAASLAVWTALVGVEGLPGPWPIFGAALLIGIGWAISVPTMQALVPALVEPEDLEQAIALNSITFNVARAVGPAFGAFALVTFGAAATFGLNAATFVVLIVALLVIRPRHVERGHHASDGSVRAGLRFVRGEPALVVLLVGVTALGFGTDPVNTLTPAMADLLGGGDGLVGVLVSAFGAGASGMAFAVGAVRRRIRLSQMAVIGLAVLAAGLVGFAASGNAVLAAAALFVAGAGFLLALTGLTTELQRRAPEHFLGRVMALWTVAFLGSRPVAAMLDGALADAFGPRVAALTAAVLCAAVCAFVVRARRRLGLDGPAVPLASTVTSGESAPPVSG